MSRLVAEVAYDLRKRRLEWSFDYRDINGSSCVFFVHQLKGSLYWLVLYLVLTFLLQSSSTSWAMSNGENLGVRLQLLRNKKHLDIHLQPLLKSASPFLFVCHHVGCKPAKSQEFGSIFIH